MRGSQGFILAFFMVEGGMANRLKASDKLRIYYMKGENDMGGFHPLGQGTKSDLGYLLFALEPIWKELEQRGYDPKTLKLSIEPKAGNTRFASQREITQKSDGS